MTSRRIAARGLDFAVIEEGGGGDGADPGDAPSKNRLLLVHGFTGNKEDFEDHIGALADAGWHVAAADHRGHGESDKPAGEANYSMSIMADDMIALADALGWDDFVLLGHSMGGMVAQHMAADHPDRLRALVLMDTSPVCPDGLDAGALELGKQIVRENGLEALVAIQADGPGPLDTPAHQRMVATVPGYAERGAQNTRACSPDMWCAIVTEIVEQPDRLDALRGVRVPALVIVGDQDTPFMAHSERMAKTIPDARLAVIPDAGHSPQFEAPDAWFAALSGFLEEVRS